VILPECREVGGSNPSLGLDPFASHGRLVGQLCFDDLVSVVVKLLDAEKHDAIAFVVRPDKLHPRWDQSMDHHGDFAMDFLKSAEADRIGLRFDFEIEFHR
jgi:hypothetical protein